MRVEFREIEEKLVGSLEEGMILVDKPRGVSSFGVVACVRGAIQGELRRRAEDDGGSARGDGAGGQGGGSHARGGGDSVQGGGKLALKSGAGKRKVKVGHTGTLDPFATGLLILMVGKGTRRCEEFLKLDKWYEAELRLGAWSTTGDPEGGITPGTAAEVARAGAALAGDGTRAALGADLEMAEGGGLAGIMPVTEKEILLAMERLTGEIWQTVPKFSAVKVGGRRAYDLARKGVEVEMPRRRVTVYEWELLGVEEVGGPGNGGAGANEGDGVGNAGGKVVRFRCHVGSGTYVRTLGEDLAKELGTVGYLTSLRRLRIGEYGVEGALKLSADEG